MKYTRIPAVDINVSQIILGTWVFSGTNWGGSDENDCIAAVHAAIDHGVTTIDTAPIYGYGLAETLVGKAIKGRRSQLIIATKCGLSGRGKGIHCDLKPQTILKEIDESLKRLQTDYIDIYQCHWPDPNTPLADTLKCLKSLQDLGKIRCIGVSNFNLPLLREAVAIGCVATLQSPLSMLDRALNQEIVPFCQQNDIGVFAYGSLGGGILTGKYEQSKVFTKDDARSFFYKFYAGEKFTQIRGFLDQLKSLKRPLNQVAINWVRQQEGVSSAIVGSRNAEQIIQNITAVDWDLSTEKLAMITRGFEEFNL